MIREPRETTKLTSDIEDVIDQVFDSVFLVVHSTSDANPVTSLYGTALWAGFVDRVLHSIGSKNKHKVALHNFWYCFEANAQTNKQLMAYSKASMYCNSARGNLGAIISTPLLLVPFSKHLCLFMTWKPRIEARFLQIRMSFVCRTEWPNGL